MYNLNSISLNNICYNDPDVSKLNQQAIAAVPGDAVSQISDSQVQDEKGHVPVSVKFEPVQVREV